MYLDDVESCAPQVHFWSVGISDPILPFKYTLFRVFIRHDYNDGVFVERIPERVLIYRTESKTHVARCSHAQRFTDIRLLGPNPIVATFAAIL